MTAPGPTARGWSGLLVVLMAAPLLLLAVGAWQCDRAVHASAVMRAEAAGLAAQRDTVLARRPEQVRFSDDTVLPFAQAMPLLDGGVNRLQQFARLAIIRRSLAWMGPTCGLLALLAGALFLVTPAVAARQGRGSPDAMARAVIHFAPWPPMLLAVRGLLILLGMAGVALFEMVAFLDPNTGLLGILRWLAAIVGPAVFVVFWPGLGALERIRSAMITLPLGPAPVVGRIVSQQEAPALWRFVEAVADRAGVSPPPCLVLALADRCRALPAGAALAGGTEPQTTPGLLLPLPALALLGPDGTAAAVAGELSRLGGPPVAAQALTAYDRMTLRLLLVADTRDARGPATLLRPAQVAAEAVRDGFRRLAEQVGQWQARDADHAAARATSIAAAARTVLRAEAAAMLLRGVLDGATAAPGTAPPDLVVAALDRATAGLPDPTEPGTAEPPSRPTPEDPPLALRLAALDAVPDAALRAAACCPPNAADRDFASGMLAGRTGLDNLGPTLTAELVRLAEEDAAEFEGYLRADAATPVPSETAFLDRSWRKLGIVGVLTLGLGMLLVPVALSDTGEWWLWPLAAILVVFALWLLAAALFRWTRRAEPLLVVTPPGFQVAGLSGPPVPWTAVQHVSANPVSGQLVLTFTLTEGAHLPRRVGWRPGLRVSARTRQVAVSFTPAATTVEACASLVENAWRAARVRHVLGTDLTR